MRASATLGEPDRCPFCDVMFEVPAAIACARAGDAEAARRHLAAAERSASLWEGSAWQAAVLEAESYVRLAEGDADGFQQRIRNAGHLFETAAARSGLPQRTLGNTSSWGSLPSTWSASSLARDPPTVRGLNRAVE